jgi:putative endonuclease
MPESTHAIGRLGEDLAVDFLRRKGYKILKRNYRTRFAEIDLIAKHQGTLVFVEVKSRRSPAYGHPKEALTPAKQRRISMAALAYLKQVNALDRRARFDVVTVQSAHGRPTIEVIPNAFELAYP